MEGLELMQPFWRDRSVFVTGATGLLGSWLVKRLIEQEASVVCLVRDWVPASELVLSKSIEKVNVVRGNVRNQSLLERILGEYEVDTVFHLAAQTIVGIANRNPVSTFQTNIGGTTALLEACRRSPTVKQIVAASSDKAYGEHDALPYTETTPLAGKHPYDTSKAAADFIVQCYAATYDLPVAITRCGNLFGGGDLNWNRIVPGTIRSAIRQETPLIRSDGNYVRDYFHVEDAASAYLLLAEALSQNPNLKGQAYNFSYEQPTTVLDMANRILTCMGSSLKPKVLNEASNEIKRQYLDAGRAKQELGWKAAVGPVEGIKRTIAWYHDFFGVRA